MTSTISNVSTVTDTDTATVRETLVEAYGPDWHTRMSHVLDVTDAHRYTGNPYPATYEYVPVVVLNHTMGSDVYGYAEPVTIANYRVLRDEWSDVEGLSDGPYSGSSHIALDLDAVAPVDLIDVLDALENYPLLDEQVWSDVEQETIRDHWESYGIYDVSTSVAHVLDVERCDLTDHALETLETLVWSGVLDYGYGSGYPSMVDVSSCDFGTDEVAGWVREYVGSVESVTVDRYGEPLIVDTRREVWVRSV